MNKDFIFKLLAVIVAIIAIYSLIVNRASFDKKEVEQDICLTDHIYQELEQDTSDEVSTTAVSIRTALWLKGDTMKIYFYPGMNNAEQQQALTDLQKWGVQIVGRGKPGNAIDLFATTVNTRAAADVGYKKSTGNGSWAYVGRTDVGNVFKNRVTINTTAYSAPHEWGHVLARGHEHQNGMDAIKWDKPYVYEYMAKRGWNKAKVDHNFFRVYVQNERTDVDAERDVNSIMHYRFPVEFVLPESRNKLAPGSPTSPSVRDLIRAQKDYPIVQAPPPPTDPVDPKDPEDPKDPVTPPNDKLEFAAKYFLEKKFDVYRLRKPIKLKLLKDLWGVDSAKYSDNRAAREIVERLGIEK